MPQRPIRVLLIDDDEDDVALIEHFLAEAPDAESRHFSFEVKSADRAASGCGLLAQERFDAVLLDLMLPGGSGIEAFSRVLECGRQAPIVVLTGLKEESLAMKAISLGAQDYLVKGAIDGRTLKRAILYAIERRRQAARMESILKTDLDGKIIVDAAAAVRFLNPAASSLLGQGERELIGKPLPLPRPSRLPADVRLGDDRIVEMRAVDLDWGGEPAELITLREVSEFRRIEQLRAEVKERMLAVDLKNEFMTTISHELRNPLTTVKTAVQSLRDGLVGPLTAQQMRFVDLAHRNVERQIRIINNVLELARLQSGRGKVDLSAANLPLIVSETLQAYALSRGGPRVETVVGQGVPEILADPDLVTQVVTNLVDNALRYAREKVMVRVSKSEREEEKGALLSIADDGPGITESQASRLFSKFVQAERAPGSAYKGTGLGLAICKEILASHGGRIWVESVAGKGARFCCFWPASPLAAVTERR